MEVLYPNGRRVPEWERAHAEGAVPDRWPYGLHRVRTGSESLPSFGEALPLKSLAIMKSFMTGLRSPINDHTAIAWDEDTAIRLFLQRPRARKFAGVIWATDRLNRCEFSLKDVVLRRILPKFDGLWVLSRAQEEVLRDWLGADTPPISYLPFGIDEGFFTPHPYPARPYVISLGRDRDRDPATLFEALEEVKRRRPDVQIGVQTMATSKPPAGVHVLPLMPHSELRKLYRASTVVAVATRPNVHVSGMTVALEAMATCRPVVMSDTPGMSGYVEHGVTGILVKPQNAECMAAGILDLLGSPNAAAQMGERGRKRVEARHTTQRMASTLSAIIRDL